MTLRDLLHNQPTLEQLRILAVSDYLLPCGRYYGGQLTDEQVEVLKPASKQIDVMRFK